MEGELKTSADARPPAWRSAFRVRFALESPRRCSWHGTSGFRFSLRLLNGQTLLPVGRRVEDAGPKGRRTLEPPRPILAHASRPGRTINAGALPPPATPGARSAPLTSRRRARSCSASFDLDIDCTPMIRGPGPRIRRCAAEREGVPDDSLSCGRARERTPDSPGSRRLEESRQPVRPVCRSMHSSSGRAFCP